MPRRAQVRCLDCGRPHAGSGRCPDCRRRRDAQRGTTAERGLSGAHARISRRFRDLDLLCVICGQHGTPANPITAGHIVPRSKGGSNDPGNYQPECRSCNSRKGAW